MSVMTDMSPILTVESKKYMTLNVELEFQGALRGEVIFLD